MKKILLLIISAVFLFGCSNTTVMEIAIVKEVNKNSIVIENWGGETTKIEIPHTNDFTFEEDKEYYIKYEIFSSGKTVLISAESNEN